MTDRDRLAQIILKARINANPLSQVGYAEADALLANGVIVLQQGEWKIHQNNEYWHYDCPFCDDGYATKGQDKKPPNYCGNCGAKLKELNK